MLGNSCIKPSVSSSGGKVVKCEISLMNVGMQEVLACTKDQLMLEHLMRSLQELHSCHRP